MSKAIYYIFLVLFGMQSLFPKGEIMEIIHVPALYTHYKAHCQKTHHQFSWVEFYSLHYGAKAKEHAKQEKHSDLPFQHASHAKVVDFHYIPNGFFMETLALRTARERVPLYDMSLPSPHPFDIFQPPRV